MRKQRLPKELWSYLPETTKGSYCFWWNKDQMLCKAVTNTPKDAYDFVSRAKAKQVPAFACAYVPSEAENQVIAFSPFGILSKYAFVDWVNLSIGKAWHQIILDDTRTAESENYNRISEQWTNKTYNSIFKDAKYEVSYYDTDAAKHAFKHETFKSRNEAKKRFDEIKVFGFPCRLSEFTEKPHKLNEIEAANQTWHIGMGIYLEHVAAGSLPLSEVPYIFTNKYLTSEMKVDNGYGYLDFHVGFNNYTIQIAPSADGKSVRVSIDKEVNLVISCLYYNNGIFAPWLLKIKRGW